MRRSLVYQRAKNVDDTLAFGTRRDVYAPHHEWACHSMFPKPPVPMEDAVSELSTQPRRRVWIGTPEFGTTRPYSASILNISAMSYGAISDNAILALSSGAKMGHFFHVRLNDGDLRKRPGTHEVTIKSLFCFLEYRRRWCLEFAQKRRGTHSMEYWNWVLWMRNHGIRWIRAAHVRPSPLSGNDSRKSVTYQND